jgi:hypothetical protein
MTIKSKLAGALFAALTVAAPLALSASPADAAPMRPTIAMRNDHDNGGGRMDAFHDRNHRPPMRAEHRPSMPHGHYRWRAGAWNWHGNQWTWAPGLYIRF